MHRRPHDQTRVALREDIRRLRPAFLAVDVYLLAMSLVLFLRPPPSRIPTAAGSNQEGKHAQPPPSDDFPGHDDL